MLAFMSNRRKVWIPVTAIVGLLMVVLIMIWQPSIIRRVPFHIPEASYDNWDDILSHPRPISISTYSTGVNQTKLSGIMNLEHEAAGQIEDGTIGIPVIVCVIQHPEFGAHLVDAGLDSSYVRNQYGSMKDIVVRKFLVRGSQEPGKHIAAILEQQNIQIQGVFLTHLHFDHTAGIVDLPKDIPYVVGKGDPYRNYRFIIQGDHLAGIRKLQEIDLRDGVDLPPFGRSVDVFGDGSFWAIPTGGHSKGHMAFFINGIDPQVLFTGDACNTLQQFETGIGPGFYSQDDEQGQIALDRIIEFKELYPEVTMVFGHDLATR